MRIALRFSALWLISSLCGCATVHHGTSQSIPIVSNPAGAAVSIDGVPAGVTPLVARVSRKQNHIITVARDSLAPLAVPLEHQVSLWTLGNWMLAILPASVDFADGAAYRFNVDTVLAVFPGATRSDSPIKTPSVMLQRQRIDGEARTMAVVSSAIVGLGSGHSMIDASSAGRPFRNSQVAGLTAAMVGMGMALGNNNSTGAAGAVLFVGGAGVFVVSRVWEVVDVISRSGH